jgi:hypothetical protein
MCGVVLAVGMLKLPVIVLLMIQVVLGVAVYLLLSAAFRLQPYRMLLDMLKKKAGK